MRIKDFPYIAAIGILSVIFLSGCSDNANEADTIKPSNTRLSNLEGIWKQQGYGLIFEFDSRNYTLYEYSNVHCIIIEQGLLTTLDQSIVHFELQNDKTTFNLTNIHSQTIRYFDKQSTFPAGCANGVTSESHDPELNFEVFWHSFNEQYAFFDIREVDWQEQYETYRPQVSQDTTSDELFEILSNLIRPLKDGHVGIQADSKSFIALNSAIFDRLVAEFAQQSEYSSFYEFIEMLISTYQEVAESYLINSVSSAANNIVRWGELSETKGYLAINSMLGFSDSQTLAAELSQLNSILDNALADLASKSTIVIDIRRNFGGSDEVAVAIASRFASNQKLAFIKKARNGNGFTSPQEFYLQPDEDSQYLGNVIILIGGLTSSAAENFLIDMLDRPNTTLVGERTPGIFSDSLGRALPNQWEFSISNEVFSAPSGTVYEGVGFTPDIEIEDMRQEYRELNRDPALEYVLQNL